MKSLLTLILLTTIFLAPSPGQGQETKVDLTIDGSKPHLLRTLFSVYGYLPHQSIVAEPGGVIRFRLPDGVTGTSQTGVYSYFALAGDCEVTITYQVLKLATPKTGYGSSVGLAFDLDAGQGRGGIQRVCQLKGKHGYALETNLKEREKPEEYRFVSATAREGRIGLRRAGKELIFLTADRPLDPLQEIGRMPFTDQTIRVVRLFADSGGSPTEIDARVGQIEMHADQMTGGIPRKVEAPPSRWWLWLILPTTATPFLWWRWRVRRRDTEVEEAKPRKPRPRVKKV
jgi:hypothetical protein